MGVLVSLVLIGVWVALRTEPFRPHPSLARRRVLVAVLASTAGGTLPLSLRYDWWVVHDQNATSVGRAGSPVAAGIVVAGLASAVATVTAAWGRRNWALPPLSAAWLLIWYVHAIETGAGDASGEALFGLELATWAMLLVTIATAVGSSGRIAERRARKAADRPAEDAPGRVASEGGAGLGGRRPE